MAMMRRSTGSRGVGGVVGRGVVGRGVRGVVAVALAMTLMASCVGTISRTEFREEVEARGGGLTVELVSDALREVSTSVGTDDFAIEYLTVSPVDAAVSMVVRDPVMPENLDSYAIHDGTISGIDPIVVVPDEDLDARTFPVGSIAVGRVEELADRALAELGGTGAHVSTLSVSAPLGVPRIAIRVESPRATATVYFSASGEFEEVVR